MARHKIMHAGADGWSDWTQPTMDGYRMACCDCGLVHEMQFEALKVTSHNADGTWRATALSKDKYRVQMRARRHKRATAQTRRRRAKETSNG